MLLKKKDKKVAKKKSQAVKVEVRQKTAQDWLPVKDVTNSLLYRKDKYLVAVLKVEPVNISLLSENEKKRIIAALHEVMNGLQEPMQILSIGRSVDLDGYIAGMEQLAQDTQEFGRKKLLKGYIRQAAEMAAGGDTLERRFYILLSQKQGKYAEDELKNRARELAGNIASAGLSAELCSDKLIIDLLFAFHQPGQSAFERAPDFAGPYIPTITKGVEKHG